MSIREKIVEIKKQIPEGVTLVAVSKTKPIEDIMQAYDEGQRVFGENKAQEMKEKQALLPKDIQWHMLGHLQENKVKYIVPFVSLIHSVDSLKILHAINKRAIICERVVDCLLEIDISHEETKFGLSKDELYKLLSSPEYEQMKNIRVCGLMGIGSITDDNSKTREEFRGLRALYSEIKDKFFAGKDYFRHVSMGMSGDYDIAIEEGSTIVRIGSKIFGERDYSAKK
ncbi:MAG: YggS family pyridoxal phosphate-dependent enzyme [Bacteroidales bacterium]|nr:YggS family pyridoxal phosphate-dependent enzyme [Bacteroidales bacterium]MDY6423401.1 YggS family pyridoxal phosphate-dependent enzyme [Bacteroidales bacterium]